MNLSEVKLLLAQEFEDNPGVYDVDNKVAMGQLNAKDIDIDIDLSTEIIKQYLMMSDDSSGNSLWDNIASNQTSKSARLALAALSNFDTFHMSEVGVNAKVTTVLSGLVADSVIEEGHKSALLSMAKAKVSKAELLIGQDVREGDVIRARDLEAFA